MHSEMMMQDALARGFLLFSDYIIIVPLLFVGFFCLNRKIFYHAVCLMLFSILLNVALKNMFQVPLSPALGKKGYAFPSGHMQLVTVFYGWLALKFHNHWLSILTMILLTGVGASLIHFGYHTIYDVVAALIVGILLLLLYDRAQTRWPKKTPWVLLLVASFLLLSIYLRTWHIAGYVWMAYLFLLPIITLSRLNTPYLLI